MEPEAYTYEADVHCPDCAEKRFGRCKEHECIACCVEDSEGNEPDAISPFEGWDGDIICSDCGYVIREKDEE